MAKIITNGKMWVAKLDVCADESILNQISQTVTKITIIVKQL